MAGLVGAAGLRAPAGLLLGRLALADLLAGLGLVGAFAARHLLTAPGGETSALGAAGLLVTGAAASLGSVLAIALLTLLWLLCVAFGLLPPLGWHCLRGPPAAWSALRPVTRAQAALLAAAARLVFGLLLPLYASIGRIACRHAQQLAAQRHLAAAPRRGPATLALLLATFALWWVPPALYALLADATYPPACIYALALPTAASALLQPLLYAFRNPDRQAALSLAGCRRLPAAAAAGDF